MSTSTSRVLAKYAALDSRADLLLGEGPPAIEPADVPAPTPTYVHAQTLDLIDQLFAYVSGDNNGGAFGPMIKFLHSMRARLLKDFARVPPEQIQAFLHELGSKMLAIGSVDPNRPELGPGG